MQTNLFPNVYLYYTCIEKRKKCIYKKIDKSGRQTTELNTIQSLPLMQTTDLNAIQSFSLMQSNFALKLYMS